MSAVAKYPFLIVSAGENSEAVESMLWDFGATGIETRDAQTLNQSADECLVAHFDSVESAEQAQDAIQQSFSDVRAEISFVEGDAWRDAWKEYFKPTRCGKHLVVKPSWETFESQPGDVVLTLDPGAAFGTGTHETTQLILRLLDARAETLQQKTVLDMGCGSGILSVAALLLGADEAWACDNDPLAIDVTLESAEINHVGDRVKAICDDTMTLPPSWPSTFDLVLANIELRVLEPYAQQLSSFVGPSGSLMLSGLLKGQDAAMHQAISKCEPALRHEETLTMGEWIAMVYRREG